MRLSFSKMLGLSALAGLMAMPALAAPQLVETSRDWRVYKESVDGQTICYAATQATDTAPAGTQHGEVWFFVSNWQGGVNNQPSLQMSMDLRQDTPPKATIGRQDWTLLAYGNEAFAADGDDDAVVAGIKRGSELRVQGVTTNGTVVAYHFSLSGSSNAVTAARAACR